VSILRKTDEKNKFGGVWMTKAQCWNCDKWHDITKSWLRGSGATQSGFKFYCSKKCVEGES